MSGYRHATCLYNHDTWQW